MAGVRVGGESGTPDPQTVAQDWTEAVVRLRALIAKVRFAETCATQAEPGPAESTPIRSPDQPVEDHPEMS